MNLKAKSLAAAVLVVTGLSCASANAHVITAVPDPATDEASFIQYVMDHHFGALRMTELAAGTAATAPTPGFPTSPQHATNALVLDLSVMNNSMQRMEISELNGMLGSWYGITNYQPHMLPSGQALVNVLEAAGTGTSFDIAFLETFSIHHFSLLGPAQDCSSSAPHGELRDKCMDMVEMQSSDIAKMTGELCGTYGICDFQPVALGPADTSLPPIDTAPVEVPEPASVGLVALGMLGLFLRRRSSSFVLRPAPA